jgi:hypothetical protein
LFQADVDIQPMLLHLAQVVWGYHEEETKDLVNFGSAALARFGSTVVKKKIVDALECYSAGQGARLMMAPQHPRFWLYSGEEFSLHALF